MANSKITDFFPGTTKRFSLQITLNGAAVDLTSDTLTFRIKADKDEVDGASLVEIQADVVTSGADGHALFSLAPADTSLVPPGSYYCDITWYRSSGEEYVVYDNSITIKDRVSDA